ncbi:MAG: toprim domain-containing protein [Thermoplasmata archaeon]|uniref:Toprim domain-containing protein n=1 Tax=Candidatus Sysuiplasma superficiale TaxID=2823368 RepID=A0A8J7YUI8_9ARCH|nr:toprim domain-containing protein [Candidatus Sysuiplasma superficiale]MBX8644387.1 toprim domain-containing protein [Candidatus Sysuiplasma superficiale]MCL4346361.1 toprim domain-containing protein [Candidatus Thermoplasmatota archaeon]
MNSSAEMFERMEKLIEELSELNSRFPIIVEGRNDRKAMRALGIGGEIYVLNGKHTIFEMCEKLSRKYSRVIIMTDWDRKGGQLCRALSNAFISNGVKTVEHLRAQIASISVGESKDVEGLPLFYERLRKRALR